MCVFVCQSFVSGDKIYICLISLLYQILKVKVIATILLMRTLTKKHVVRHTTAWRTAVW